MTKQLLFILLLLTFKISSAQNLIPNGDFELGPDSSSIGWCCRSDSTCIIFGSVAGPDDWTIVNLTPDRFLNGDIFCDWDVITAQSENAFIDFVYNEKAKTTLVLPLEIDSVYHLTYHACWQSFQGAATAPSRIKFTFNNGGNAITSPFMGVPLIWQTYDTLFTASANSTELEISGIQNVVGGVNLDNISLVKINTITGLNDLRNLNNSIFLFPNPVTDQLNISVKTSGVFEITLYDIASRKILRQEFEKSTIIEMVQLAKGVYIYEVRDENGLSKNGKIVKE